MKRYYMFNFDETTEMFIGEFTSDSVFLHYYMKNESDIVKKQSKLDRGCKSWYYWSI